MYKFIDDNTFKRIPDNTFIPKDDSNRDYQRFLIDINDYGIGIVEGADYVDVISYTDARKTEYPPIEDQLDKIYHDGIEAWRTDITRIKNKYPKSQVGITSTSPLPQWVIDLTSS